MTDNDEFTIPDLDDGEPIIDEHVEMEIKPISPTPPPSPDTDEFTCDLCDWKPHKNCKDPQRARRNHYKSKHPDYYAKHFPTRKKTKVNILQATDKIVTEIQDHTTNFQATDEEKREKLLEDLNVLKIKFKDINYEWTYTPESSLEFLQREKTIFLRLVQDKVAEQSLFRLLIVAGKGAERISNSLQIADIDGYAGELANAEDEIIPIIRELVDTNVIDAKALTPEMRLAMVCVSLLVTTAEKRKVQKNEVADTS